jgi:hypothetical protein
MAVTPPEPPSSLLERAAQRLEELATGYDPEVWKVLSIVITLGNKQAAEWMKSMTPAVVTPIARWLRDSASSVREHDEDLVANGEKGRYCPNEDQAIELARLILGEPVPGEDE